VISLGTLDDGTVFYIGKSVDDPRAPEVPGSVRAYTSIYGFLLKPVPDRSGQMSTHVQYLSLSDPKGRIPYV